MTVTAATYFSDAYGERDPRAAGTAELRIETSAGRKEIILDPPNLRVKALGLRIEDLGDPAIAAFAAGLQDAAVPYTKFTVYALPGDDMAWITRGYLKEGEILGFFADGIDAHVWALYGDDGRDEAPRDAEHDGIVALALGKEPAVPEAPTGYDCPIAGEDDAPAISELMRATFPDYPTPLDEAAIAVSIREDGHRFRILVDPEGEPAAVASAEIDHARRAAEMTDCATRPDQRGRGLMSYLLWRLERDMVRDYDIRDLYTLARADEPGMNIAFARLGYGYTGRLVNNCRMPNGWESMNIWCRRVERVSGLDPALAF